MHENMQYESEFDSDIETARANAIYYKNKCDSQGSRIAELEQALRQAQSLLRSSQSNWNEQAYFDADTVIANALK